MIPRTPIPKTPTSVYPSRLFAILVKRFNRELSRDPHQVLTVRLLCEAAERPLSEAVQFRLNAFCYPCDTQGMQHELISRTQLTGVFDGLKCVINVAALCDTPGFVTNDSVTVDTG